mmetsp:Transcript_23792/g.72796  ORF Transcript_23792/g.72796 Transcript_23792/m.72796 type:complete len:229 (-) Transcript_23792:1486-2172(-)|eukprot:scaffold162476_cov35-Tisochrysis_lutea.AAC.3
MPLSSIDPIDGVSGGKSTLSSSFVPTSPTAPRIDSMPLEVFTTALSYGVPYTCGVRVTPPAGSMENTAALVGITWIGTRPPHSILPSRKPPVLEGSLRSEEPMRVTSKGIVVLHLKPLLSSKAICTCTGRCDGLNTKTKPRPSSPSSSMIMPSTFPREGRDVTIPEEAVMTSGRAFSRMCAFVSVHRSQLLIHCMSSSGNPLNSSSERAGKLLSTLLRPAVPMDDRRE